MSDQVPPLDVSQAEYEEILKHEYIVVREWESAEGKRFGHLQFWGEEQECKDVANTNALVIVPNGVKLIGDQAIKVKDLIDPQVE